MAYSELIKNFDGIRDYMREFYVYGFRRREEFTRKSARSYDDERRRVESWLGDYMGFRRLPDGKNVFLSIDSRRSHHNPLYKAWKAKSFTDGDITLHFLIFDILYSPDVKRSLNELTEEIDNRLSCFENPKTFDASTVRKKLGEYADQGLIVAEKSGKTIIYSRAGSTKLDCTQALDFFSETAPCGVVGSFLLDKADKYEAVFTFKHHYITQTTDSDILYSLFDAMHKKAYVRLKALNRRLEREIIYDAVPLCIFVSVQNGRQYLMAYIPRNRRFLPFRLDNILWVEQGEHCDSFDAYRDTLNRMKAHIWGVSTKSNAARTEHIDFTVRFNDDEQYIFNRLEREKRCGTVVRTDRHTARFSADVYDTGELIPWIRTFICRITDIHFSDTRLEAQFKEDICNMYRLYGLNGGDTK